MWTHPNALNIPIKISLALHIHRNWPVKQFHPTEIIIPIVLVYFFGPLHTVCWTYGIKNATIHTIPVFLCSGMNILVINNYSKLKFASNQWSLSHWHWRWIRFNWNRGLCNVKYINCELSAFHFSPHTNEKKTTSIHCNLFQWWIILAI